MNTNFISMLFIEMGLYDLVYGSMNQTHSLLRLFRPPFCVCYTQSEVNRQGTTLRKSPARVQEGVSYGLGKKLYFIVVHIIIGT